MISEAEIINSKLAYCSNKCSYRKWFPPNKIYFCGFYNKTRKYKLLYNCPKCDAFQSHSVFININ